MLDFAAQYAAFQRRDPALDEALIAGFQKAKELGLVEKHVRVIL